MKSFKLFLEGEGKYKGETWEDGYKRRVVEQLNLNIKKKVIIGELKVKKEMRFL